MSVTDSTIAINMAANVQGGAAGAGGSGLPGGASGSAGSFGVASGGGAYVGAGSADFENSTVAGNAVGSSGGSSGGGVVNSATVTAGNTLFADNSAPSAPDFSGGLISNGFNLFGNTSGASGLASTDLQNVNPDLAALQNNGGPTDTMALLAGSPAIDAGNPNYSTNATDYDQRGPGYPRIFNGGLDIGAFEVGPIAITVTSLSGLAGTYDPSTQQATTLAAAVNEANTYNDGDTIVFSAGLTGPIDLNPNDSGNAGAVGTLTLSRNMTIQGPGDNAITIDGGTASGNSNNVEVLSVNSGVTAYLNNLVIANGDTTNSNSNGLTTRGGGGISNDGTLTVTNCTFDNNSAPDDGDYGYGGGGIYNQGILTVTNSTFDNNSAPADGYGGGINNNDGTLTATNCTFDNNSASFGGGGIYDSGTMTVTNCTFDNNNSDPGGGILGDSGMMTVADCTFDNNSAGSGSGGGICLNYGTLTVTNCTFYNNSAGGGGGISTDATLTTLTVTNSTFYKNSASYAGGGIGNLGTLTVTNSTFDNNSAPNATWDYAYVGCGGILNGGGGTVTLTNTLLANDTGGDYWGNDLSSTSSNNLIGESGELIFLNGNPIFNFNPGLDPSGLENTGGPTETIALLPGSQAIGAGTSSGAPSTDQRGVTRNPDSVDIGAYQTLITVGPGTLPSAMAGIRYNRTLTASGGTSPYTFSATYGTLPPGLTLSPDGVLSGVPNDAGSYTFVVAATDASADSGPFSGSQMYNVLVAPNPYSGSYAGTTSGTVTVSGHKESVSGRLNFSVNSAGAITVTNPGQGQGSMTPSGNATLSGVGTIGGISNVSYSCTGTIVNGSSGVISVQGTWTAAFTAGRGSGTWSATLVPTVAVSDGGGTYNGKSFPASATATGAGGAALTGAVTVTFSYYAGSRVAGAASRAHRPTPARTRWSLRSPAAPPSPRAPRAARLPSPLPGPHRR